MTAPLETLVADDLRELAAETGHPRALEPATGGAFRDARGYALAQRARFLLQHASKLGGELSRSAPIYAARVARIVTALGLLAYTVGLFAAYPPESRSRWVPEPLLNHWMAAFALLFVYVVAHRLAAGAFRRRLAASALPPPEGALPQDAPRIPERARQAIDRLDSRTVGATIAACCAFAPMFAYTWVAQHLSDLHGTWGALDAEQLLSVHELALYSVAGAGVGLLVGHACWRVQEASEIAALVRFLGSLPALALGLALAFVSSGIVGGMLIEESVDAPPSELAVGASSVLAALLIGSWLALRLRAREQARLAPGAPPSGHR